MSVYEHNLEQNLRGWDIFNKLWQRTGITVVAILGGMWLFLV